MAGLVVAVNIVNYTLLTYMPTYFQQKIGLPSSAGLVIILIGELVMMALMPWFGSLSDRSGRRRNWLVSLIGLLILAIPMFQLMGVGIGAAVIGFAVLGLLFVPQLSTITATFPAMFPTHVRFSGFAITYNLITSLFGGTAAIVNETGVRLTGDIQFPAYYMMFGCAIGLIAVWFMPETAGASLRGLETPGAVGSAVQPGSPAERALEDAEQPQQRTLTESDMLAITAEARAAAAATDRSIAEAADTGSR